jgi:hypothetical protein
MASEQALRGALDATMEVLALEDLHGPAIALERLANARGSLVFTFDDAGRLTPLGGSLVHALETYVDEHFEQDPVHRTLPQLDPNSFVILGSSLGLERQGFTQSAAYADFYARHGAEQLLGIWPTRYRYGEPGMIGFLLTRSARQPDFERRVAEAIGGLRAPLSHAAERASRYAELQGALAATSALLESGVTGADLVWSSGGRLVWLSARARELYPVALPEGLDAAAAAWAFASRRARADLPPVHLSLRRPPGTTAAFFRIPRGDDGPWIGAKLEAKGVAAEADDDRQHEDGADLTVAADQSWILAPDGTRHSLARRPALRRILRALLDRRARRPGAPLSADELMEAGWPGEQPIREAGLNRLYVAIATLRGMGLRDALVHDGRGYRLVPPSRG